MSANKFTHPEILVELLKMRQVPEEQAKVAAALFGEMVKGAGPQERTAVPPPLPVESEYAPEPAPASEKEETLNDFIRELLERVLLLPVQMLLDRLPEDQRERLRKKIVL